MIKTVIEALNLLWTQINSWRRRFGGSSRSGVIAALVVLLFVLTFMLLALQYLVIASSQESRGQSDSIKSVVDQNQYQLVLDRLQACIDSPKDRPHLQTRYCQYAVGSYQEIFRGNSAADPSMKAYVDEVIEIKAYEEMRVEVRNKMRHQEFLRLSELNPTTTQILLTWLLNRAVAISLFICIFVLPSLLAFWLFVKAPKEKIADRRVAVRWARAPLAISKFRLGHRRRV